MHSRGFFIAPGKLEACLQYSASDYEVLPKVYFIKGCLSTGKIILNSYSSHGSP
jgi:hypothetical protein